MLLVHSQCNVALRVRPQPTGAVISSLCHTRSDEQNVRPLPQWEGKAGIGLLHYRVPLIPHAAAPPLYPQSKIRVVLEQILTMRAYYKDVNGLRAPCSSALVVLHILSTNFPSDIQVMPVG